jgi:outer membrane lipoprotein-sorting protein
MTQSTTRTGVPAGATRSRRTAWAVPAGVAIAVAAAFATPPLLASAGDDALPDITPEQLAERVATAEPAPLSGTVVHTARLGLPELPLTEATGADPVALLGGSSTLRVWTDGAERSRVSLLGAASEYSVVADGPEAWTYSSTTEKVVHYMLDAAGRAQYDAAAADVRAGLAPGVVGTLPTPEEAARTALAQVEGYSTVSLDGKTTVAGRGAYQLVVTPRDAETLVGRVVVAVDAETSTPLRVQVWSVQDAQVPALEIGFTDVTFGRPDDGVLTFSVPAGASVREVVVPMMEPKEPGALEELLAAEPPAPGEPVDPALLPEGVMMTGTGWETVTEVSGVDLPALLAGDPAAITALPESERLLGSDRAQDLISEFLPDEEKANAFELDTTALYDALTTEVPEGRLISSALLSVLVTEDGRVLYGAVPPDVLRGLV